MAFRRSLSRGGFTLIEMLVVMTIILALATVTLKFLPTALDKQRVTRGAGNLQSWIAIAKSWAARDNAPRGIRLQPIRATDSGASTVAAAGFPTTITPSAMHGISPNGAQWSIQASMPLMVSDADGSNAETVIVSKSPPPTSTSFTATFAFPHTTAGFPIRVGYVQECQYIERPDAWHQIQSGTAGTLAFGSPPTANADNTATYTVTGTGVDFFGGFGPADPSAWPVQPGDFIEVKKAAGGTNVYRLNPSVATAPYQVWTSSTLTATGSATDWGDGTVSASNWTIVRRARVRVGEGVLTLPQNVAIDLNTNNSYANPLPGTGFVDVLFRPDGSVYSWGGSGDKIQLWLRDLSADAVPSTSPNTIPTLFNGEQALLTVYVRTGLIAANAVDTTLNTAGTAYNNPYYFTQDGRSSGL